MKSFRAYELHLERRREAAWDWADRAEMVRWVLRAKARAAAAADAIYGEMLLDYHAQGDPQDCLLAMMRDRLLDLGVDDSLAREITDDAWMNHPAIELPF